jgi:hypothetical protein
MMITMIVNDLPSRKSDLGQRAAPRPVEDLAAEDSGVATADGCERRLRDRCKRYEHDGRDAISRPGRHVATTPGETPHRVDDPT